MVCPPCTGCSVDRIIILVAVEVEDAESLRLVKATLTRASFGQFEDSCPLNAR